MTIKIDLENLGTVNKNRVRISNTDTNKSVDLYFSYKTIVGVNNLCNINEWSTTTGKLLNEIEPDHKKRVTRDVLLAELEKRLNDVLDNRKEIAEGVRL
ncbi:MAG: hypothetical protein WCW93_03800 [Candidatus Paceibacterota bacterium]|jgi:hypothetical protein